MEIDLITIRDLEKLKLDIENSILSKIEFIFKKNLFPNWIKGYESASTMLELTESGLKKRVQTGFYIEGIDFKRVGHKTILFNRDNLLSKHFNVK